MKQERDKRGNLGGNGVLEMETQTMQAIRLMIDAQSVLEEGNISKFTADDKSLIEVTQLTVSMFQGIISSSKRGQSDVYREITKAIENQARTNELTRINKVLKEENESLLLIQGTNFN